MKRVLEEEKSQIEAFDKEHLVPKQQTKRTRRLPLAPKNKAKQKEADKKEKMLEEMREETFLKRLDEHNKRRSKAIANITSKRMKRSPMWTSPFLA